MTITNDNGPDIVRRAHGRSVPAWHWHSLAQLQAAIGWRDAGEIIVADLSLGGWRGHWLAREWGAQLGLPAPDPVQPALAPADGEHDGNDEKGEDGVARYADTVGRLIDKESTGDVNFIAALVFARQLLAQLCDGPVRVVLAVAPLPGHAWGLENVQLVKLLCDAAAGHGFTFGLLLRGDAPAPVLPGVDIVARTAPAPLPLTFTAAPWCAIPGLLDDALAPPHAVRAGGIETLRLGGGRILISPNARPPGGNGLVPAAPVPAAYAGLPAHLRVPFELRSPVQDIAFLQREAGLRFAEGAYDLAFAILDGIRHDGLSALEAALVAAQKQNIAIALMDFERAARGDLPGDDGLPDIVRASLYQSKAWGLVMTGQPGAAEPWFARARVLLDPRRYRRLYLYLLNISALNKLRLGQPEQALAFEQEIEGQLQAMARPDWHLIYINCLNQARIHKKLGDFSRAQQYYDRGFFVTHGLRNESDLLYTNLCQAQLDGLRGEHASAFVHWLRTVLHWLSNPAPEALAPRVAQAVLGRPLSNREADVERISATLAAQLQAGAGRIGLAAAPAPRCTPLHRITNRGQAAACIGQPGWSVMLADDRNAAAPVFDGQEYSALNRMLAGLLAHLAPHIDFGGVTAILTDDRNGIELPATAREMLWSCLAWEAPVLDLAGRRSRIVPAAASGTASAAGFMVERSRAIDAIVTGAPGWEVHFKRYLAPLRPGADEQACLAQLDQPRGLAELGALLGLDAAACFALVRRMAARRLLVVT